MHTHIIYYMSTSHNYFSYPHLSFWNFTRSFVRVRMKTSWNQLWLSGTIQSRSLLLWTSSISCRRRHKGCLQLCGEYINAFAKLQTMPHWPDKNCRGSSASCRGPSWKNTTNPSSCFFVVTQVLPSGISASWAPSKTDGVRFPVDSRPNHWNASYASGWCLKIELNPPYLRLLSSKSSWFHNTDFQKDQVAILMQNASENGSRSSIDAQVCWFRAEC